MNEENIIKLCKDGDRKAQKMLFDAYAGKMMTLCRRYATDENEAKDLLQEGFINVYQNIRGFRSEGSFEGWMRSVFIHTAIRYKKKFKHHFENIETTEPVNLMQSSYNEATDQMTNEEIIRVINQLPEGYKMVFNLSVFEGLNHKEISSLLNIEESTSRSQLHKAKNHLKKILVKYFVLFALIILFLTKY